MHKGGKNNPKVILQVPCVDHFIAQEAREYCSYVTKPSAQGSKASIEVTRGE